LQLLFRTLHYGASPIDNDTSERGAAGVAATLEGFASPQKFDAVIKKYRASGCIGIGVMKDQFVPTSVRLVEPTALINGQFKSGTAKLVVE
jgi:hypothetical protein